MVTKTKIVFTTKTNNILINKNTLLIIPIPITMPVKNNTVLLTIFVLIRIPVPISLVFLSYKIKLSNFMYLCRYLKNLYYTLSGVIRKRA